MPVMRSDPARTRWPLVARRQAAYECGADVALRNGAEAVSSSAASPEVARCANADGSLAASTAQQSLLQLLHAAAGSAAGCAAGSGRTHQMCRLTSIIFLLVFVAAAPGAGRPATCSGRCPSFALSSPCSHVRGYAARVVSIMAASSA